MVRTAKGEEVSLREMILRWCDPGLVRDVQAAEAEFTEDQVRAACPCSLGGAAPGRSDSGELTPEAIARIQPRFVLAWNALDADLRSRIMISRIRLFGTPVQAGPDAPAETIPPSYVEQYDFDYGANQVRWHRGHWRAVRASLTTEASYLDDVIHQPLPLRKAMLTWCDNVLVDRYETAAMADQLAAEIRAGRLHPDRARRYAGISMFDIDRVERPWRARLKPATLELEADFRARLARGEIELTGLQTGPGLARERSPLSPVWADHMKFDWQRQSVTVEGAAFIDLTGNVPIVEAAAQAPEVAPAPERGRPRFPTDKMTAIARSRRAVRLQNNKAEAGMLLAEFCRLHPFHKPPELRTIINHLKKLYAVGDGDSAPL